MLAPVAYPWPGGVGRYNKIVATPVIGPLLAYTITLPLGYVPGRAGRPQRVPAADDAGWISSRIPRRSLLLRPREFLANARDLVTLKAAVAEQAPRYGEIKAPITMITGDADKTVSTNIHSRPLAAAVPNAKLIVLPGVGHMVQNAVPDLVISEIEAVIGHLAPES